MTLDQLIAAGHEMQEASAMWRKAVYASGTYATDVYPYEDYLATKREINARVGSLSRAEWKAILVYATFDLREQEFNMNVSEEVIGELDHIATNAE